MIDRLREEYRAVATRYLAEPGEGELYRASMLGREFIKAECGPGEVVQLHLDVLDEIQAQHDEGRHREIAHALSAVILEAMMAYSESHQQIKKVLHELQERYRELDEAKSDLERSQDELREKTAQLIQTEKMTALGELTAGVAHEINQPLNAIKIICADIVMDLRKDRFEQGQLGESLEDVLAEVTRMAEIIDHMRIFTRRTEGDQRERIEAAEPVEGVFKLLGQQLKIRGIDVTQDLERGLYVEGNAVRLQQVIMNLITNARDAVSQGGEEGRKAIDIRVYRDAGGPSREACVVYEVRDSGCGIPGHLQEKIFEPFYTRKAPGDGTGLGLSVTMQIVSDHGGQISVASEVGEGTCFKVFLPEADDGEEGDGTC